MSSQSEWDQCWSAKRFYVALNETLLPGELSRVLRCFFKRHKLGRFDRQPYYQLNKSQPYAAWLAAMAALATQDPSGEELWVTYVHELYPIAPPRFEYIGRKENERKRPPPELSPRCWPYPHRPETDTGSRPRP